jgi:hypothetical protein
MSNTVMSPQEENLKAALFSAQKHVRHLEDFAGIILFSPDDLLCKSGKFGVHNLNKKLLK